MVTFRKAAGVVVLTLGASVLSLPLAAPAQAAPPVEKAFVIANTNADDNWGLYVHNTPSGPSATVVADTAASHTFGLSSSSDGSRIIYVQVLVSNDVPVTQRVVVRDVSTRSVRVLESRPFDFLYHLGAPALSPDGTKAVWEVFYDNGDASQVFARRSLVGAGTFSTLKVGLSPYAFLDNTYVLAQDLDGNPFSLPFSGGTPTAVSGLPVDAFHVTVSPDGSKVAYALFDESVPDGQPSRSTMNVAPLSLVSGTASVGTATVLASGAFDRQPSFSVDGSKVYWVRTNGTPTGAGDIWSAPTNGNTAAAAVVPGSVEDEQDVAIATTDNGTAPGAVTAQPALLAGTAAAVRWALPTDADLSGVRIIRKLNGVQQGGAAYVPAPQTTFVSTGLTLGQTYTYELQAVDRSNNLSAAVTVTLTALQAAPTFADPTSNTATGAPFPVTFGPANGTFYVDYVRIGSGTWQSWVTGLIGRTRTFGGGSGGNVLPTVSTPGSSYVFRVRVADTHGNSTAWVSSARAVVPFDQTRATLVGGSNRANGAAWLGGFRILSSAAHSAKLTVVGSRFQVVGWRCTSCGSFDVYEGTTKVATISSYSTTTQARRVLFSRSYGRVGTHTFTIRPLGTSGHPNVLVDGFAVRT